jgi:hypothetical protein
LAEDDEAGDCVVNNEIEFVENVSNIELLFLKAEGDSIISLEICGGSDARNFLKIHPSSVPPHPLASHAIIDAQNRFHGAAKFPPQPLHTPPPPRHPTIVSFSPSAQRPIGKQAIGVKESALI